MVEIEIAKRVEITRNHRDQANLALAARQGVTKLTPRGQRRRPGGDHADGWKMVSGNLENLRWILKAVYLI